MHDAAFLTTATRHGGGLMKAAAAYPDAPKPWLDLSTGINPEPWRGPRAPEAELNRLPDPAALVALETAAAAAFGSAPERTAAAAGAEAAIRLLPLLLGVRSVEIVGPTYGAHAEAWRAAGVATRLIAADQAATSQAGVLIIVNPNNPDGRLTRRADLIAMARERSAAGRWLVVDESFIECTPGDSVSDLAEPGLIVLRSFGKFYGLAGVRLGFMLAAPGLIARLRALLGDWPVGADALIMGRGAYADADWRRRTEAALAERADRLDDVLSRAGFHIVGGTSLFRMTRTPNAALWFQHLCRLGVLTRPFDHTPDGLRFGVPSERDLPRLMHALEAFA
ncbi:threonine-phosphate decarboxylase CobD [Brevundimonas sp. NPDC003935]|uniref:threonine-phosphate decarboxylase CobD n=1 Tax=unclassified Brevundimonas TaxID=2622653 RepID=UPI0028AD58D0|nr:threonine-phosphate decarboxylase CobD [Brevundimonas sp.]